MHILIADDEPTSRVLLKRFVERLGHQCTSARNGAEAYKCFRESRPDVIISDWMMPEVDGLQLCKKVRAEDRRYTYFILLTSNTERSQRMMGMQAGADDYLTKPLDFEDLQIGLVAAERMTALHRRIQQQQRQLESLNRALYVEGRRDALTGIPNRLQLNEDLRGAQSRVERGEGSYCVALFDIDSFKLYNDNLGHLAGDESLRAVAKTLEDQKRANDKVYRYGGEEFCALFMDQDLAGARVAVERMRAAVEALGRPHPASVAAQVVTVSAGVARHPGDPSVSAEQLLKRADTALYRAKETGRNRVETHKESGDDQLRATA